MIVEPSGIGVSTSRRGGANEGLKTRFETCRPADSLYTNGIGEVSKHYPQRAGTRPGNFPARELLKQWLKAGYVEEEMLHPTDNGVPQGGVISPVLLNVALHGMEHALGISYTPKGVLRGPYALVRYADDF